MPNVALIDIKGVSLGEMSVPEEIFGVEINAVVMHQAVKRHLANQRIGTASTKGKGEVSGGGKKPWRQKGTGRARHGSIRSPIWRGGGIVFGPHPRDYHIDMPRKMRRLAIKLALSDRAAGGRMKVIDALKMDSIKTRDFKRILDDLKLEGSVLFILHEKDDIILRSSANIPRVKVSDVHNLSVFDILKYNNLIMTKDAVESLKEVLK
jgi:large subunit ribosomal protein L4